MNTRRVMACIVLVAAVVVGPAFGQVTGVTGRSALVSLEGQVTIDGKAAAIGDPVPFGATVATAAQSLCEIEFNTKNVIRLGESTTFVFNPGNLQQGSTLKKGTIALVLKNISTLAGAARFTVRTPSTVAGVRGTTFFINAIDEKTTYVCSCNGSVHVEDLARRLGARHGFRASQGLPVHQHRFRRHRRRFDGPLSFGRGDGEAGRRYRRHHRLDRA